MKCFAADEARKKYSREHNQEFGSHIKPPVTLDSTKLKYHRYYRRSRDRNGALSQLPLR